MAFWTRLMPPQVSLLIGIVLIAGAMFVGNGMGKRSKAAELQPRIDTMAEDLQAAQVQTALCGSQLEQVSLIAQAEEAKAAAARTRADASAHQAELAHRELDRRRDSINRQAQAERGSCPFGQTPICGAPLE